MAQSSDRPWHCIICLQPLNLKEACPSCKKANYCSQYCRDTDAPIHELLCSSTKKFQKSNHPKHMRAIIFSRDESKPSFVWIRGGKGNLPRIEELEELLGCNKVVKCVFQEAKFTIKFQPLLWNNMRNWPITGLVMAYRKEKVETEGLNKALGKVLDICKRSHVSPEWVVLNTSPKQPVPELPTSNIIIFGIHEGRLRSLGHRDFRNIVDCLRLCQDQKASLPFALKFRSRIVAGVRINCNGDMAALNVPRFEQVHLPQDHPIFQEELGDSHGVAQVIDGIGTFKTMQLGPSISNEPPKYFKNTDAYLMLGNLDPGSKHGGTIDPKYAPVCGIILVVRADRRDIDFDRMMILVGCTWRKKGPDGGSQAGFKGCTGRLRLKDRRQIVEQLVNELLDMWEASCKAEESGYVDLDTSMGESSEQVEYVDNYIDMEESGDVDVFFFDADKERTFH